MDENESKSMIEAVKQRGNLNVATRIKQCVIIIGVVAITIFACVYFDNPKYLNLLWWLLLAF